MTATTILFDINETVLDLSGLKPQFTQVFASEDAISLWFAKLLHTSAVCITTGVRSDFATLCNTCLESIAAHFQVSLTASERAQLLAGFASLSPHDDIKPALAKLRANGFKTVAFSNSSSELIATQIRNAKLNDYFDDIVSVEATGSFKPNPDVYHYVSQHLKTDCNQLRLVATHDWDTHGALSQGMQAAYIARRPAPYNPLYLQVDIQGTTMMEIVDSIIATK
ncbi:haloacid dehalogenase type II [Shewanella intestini]|uniref:(S)-2-haloacid dehalogenase n=1 Tax=Shewanella intestini TaxID=2017544 RepID=A0ABS5HZ79_9GAMM|nr:MULTISPECIES: haloacid dehalogenase type II [Shewanella]MBR9726873.1 haloacid dehalogenase type II [Shewanella intestini]MRG34561.1 haloacid dehalogenase type II [Shewanella sp. XMDDZSB0408]